eukprot:10951501-Alexandrium_andersonii.AAC.1
MFRYHVALLLPGVKAGASRPSKRPTRGRARAGMFPEGADMVAIACRWTLRKARLSVRARARTRS